MINKSVLKFSIIIFLLLVIYCKQDNEFQKIRDGNFDIVIKGTYRGKPTYIGQGSDYEELVNSIRNEIEKNHDILPLITKHFFSVPESLIYKFKFTFLDREKNYLILRYFARIGHHPLYAGYQIQFVFDINSKNLKQIFTAEVPLE